MGRINVLDKHVAELIAAGEVVERPSSVIKELVENSIDAGANAITVEIKNGGTTFMRVTDNGHGIMRDDIRNAFLRHATSKVTDEYDLESISTLGFRGEALASVSAVAKVELITCADCEENGTSYTIHGGEEVSFIDAGCPVGTTIIVRDLFYNIPARQKFLKKDIAEGNAVSLVIDRIALSHPEIAFTFIRDSKQVLKTAGDGKLRSAIYSVYGREFSNSLIDVDYELEGIKVQGYISRPEGARPNRNLQTFFVNNRYIKSRTAGAAVDEAAKGSVMVGKFLSCVLNITMAFNAVDVNVHPAKIEVRFVNERPLFNAVYHAVKSALIKGDIRREAVFSTPTPKLNNNPFAQFDIKAKDVCNDITNKGNEQIKPPTSSIPKYTSSEKVTPFYNKSFSVHDSSGVEDVLAGLDLIKETHGTKKDDIIKIIQHEEKIDKSAQNNISTSDLSSSVSKNDVNESMNEIIDEGNEILLIEKPKVPDFKFLGEAFQTYIIIEIENELMLVDKHALHERMIYEKLKNETVVTSQLLLSPQAVILDKTVYTYAVENIDMFKECGFEIEDFGMPSLLVRSAPQYIANEDIADTVIEMAGYIAENKRDIRSEKMDWIYHNIACRAAIKAGNKSSEYELRELASRLLSDDSLRYCPHGRPVCIVLKKSEIEKQFGRA